MTQRAVGKFDVDIKPQPLAFESVADTLSRMSIDKQFHGDLEAVSQGEMLAAGTPVDGSAGYVALEWVRGTLEGRQGSFVLQHTATMTRGVPQLSITVVPDSGAKELVGLTGTMNIIIDENGHSYDFEYSLK